MSPSGLIVTSYSVKGENTQMCPPPLVDRLAHRISNTKSCDLSRGCIFLFHPSPSITCLSLSLSAKDPFVPFQCSFSSRTSRCFCVLDHNEDEIRILHFAYLCVTSIAGNTTSSLLGFTPMGVCELIQGVLEKVQEWWKSSAFAWTLNFLFRTRKVTVQH